MNITIVSSSRRMGRISHRIALLLQRNISDKGHNVTLLDLNELNLPPFEERLAFLDEKPAAWVETAEKLSASDGIIFLTPEYNGGICSSLKNFIDVFAKDPFMHKPIAVATGSSGAMGGIRAAHQLQLLILALFAYPQPEMLLVGNMDKKIAPDGRLIDETFQPRIDGFLDAFIGFVGRFA